MDGHPTDSTQLPRRTCWLRFMGTCNASAGGAAICLSETNDAQPFHVAEHWLPGGKVPQRAVFEALLFGLLECLRHHVSCIHIKGYRALDAINSV